jgi:DNA-binding beta-propeller fold protein YncE
LDFWYGYPNPYPYPYGYPVPQGYVFAGPETLTGNVRLDVSPKDAAVYVDEYYAGIVDDFNGAFHHLTLTAGPHSIEIRKPDFETLVVHVYVQPRQIITYRETMQPARSVSTRAPTEPAGVTPADYEVFPGPPGALRLDITPNTAQVYVDGYYVGIVNDFSGRSQGLNLAPGTHHFDLRATGHDALAFDINIESGQVLDYRGTLTASKP